MNYEPEAPKEPDDEKFGFVPMDLALHLEGIAYSNCTFLLNGKKMLHRVSKITPLKTGQFVTIWKRNKEGITVPYDIADELDFLIITSKSGDNFGQFIFPKSVLADKGIISNNGIGGKRGMRVYPPWDITKSKQAAKTKCWQVKYFLTITNDHPINIG